MGREPRDGGRSSHVGGLHLVALFEGAKGIIVLVAGCGLLSLIHRDLHGAAARLVMHLHLNPASRYPRIFLDLAERVDDGRLWALAGAALLYALARLVEATGLWLGKGWAQWFGLLTGGMYLPIELFEVMRGATWPKVTVLVVNLSVVCCLAFVMIADGRERGGENIPGK